MTRLDTERTENTMSSEGGKLFFPGIFNSRSREKRNNNNNTTSDRRSNRTNNNYAHNNDRCDAYLPAKSFRCKPSAASITYKQISRWRTVSLQDQIQWATASFEYHMSIAIIWAFFHCLLFILLRLIRAFHVLPSPPESALSFIPSF